MCRQLVLAFFRLDRSKQSERRPSSLDRLDLRGIESFPEIFPYICIGSSRLDLKDESFERCPSNLG
jgi:hypothetical protein